MQIFGLVIMTKKAYGAEQAQQGKSLFDVDEKLGAVEADRNVANKQIERLTHTPLELTLLWAPVRHVGLQDQARVVGGAPVAAPEFEHRAAQAGDQVPGVVQAVPLGRDAADGAVEPAHGGPFVRPFPVQGVSSIIPR